jgi:DNA polymerase bacteriophage-type
MVAHNAAFERDFWNLVVRKKYTPHWPQLLLSQQDCTLARASTLALPAGLDFLTQVLHTDAHKDAAGSNLMKKMARPRKIVQCRFCEGVGFSAKSFEGITGGTVICSQCYGTGEIYTWWDSPENIERLGIYCDADIEAETSADMKVLHHTERERQVWEMDQRINSRGVKLDRPLIEHMISIVAVAKKQMDEEMANLTHDFVKSCGQVAKIAEWINLMGVPCTSVAKGEQTELLLAADATDIPEIRQVIELRAIAAKSSTAKLSKMLDWMAEDDRARGLLFYHGTIGGRWAGRGPQPQNLPQVDEEEDGDDIRHTIDIALAGNDPAGASYIIDTLVGPPLVAVAKCLRSVFIPEAGRRFIGGDKSNIEGRINAWLSGEQWKLDAFRAYDSGSGPDLYRLAYSRSFGVPVEQVRGPTRQVGKVQELACIAGSEKVLTDEGLIPLCDLTLRHRLWDGCEWVTHEGLIYRGEKETIHYDGITATPDHIVWAAGFTGPVSLAVAASAGASLVRSEVAGHPIRVGFDSATGTLLEPRLEYLLRANDVRGLQDVEVDTLGRIDERHIVGVPAVYETSSSACVALQTHDIGTTPLSEPEGPTVGGLRRPRDRISLSVDNRSLLVDHAEPAGGSRDGYRPDRQQRALRAWKSEVRDTQAELHEHSRDEDTRRSNLAESVFVVHDKAHATCRHDTGSDYRDGILGRGREAKKLAQHRGKAHVYDVLNAGPRNRFTISGVLVHNCGYQGAIGALLKMAKNKNIPLQPMLTTVKAATDANVWDEVAARYKSHPRKHGLAIDMWTALSIVVKGFREANSHITQGWWDLQDAAIEVVEMPGQVVDVFGGRVRYMLARGFMWCSLPSKRLIAYCNPKIRETTETLVRDDGTEYERTKKQVWYEGYDSEKNRWSEFPLYGGMQCAHVVSAIARDCLVEDMLLAESRGYSIVLTVHDELLTEQDYGVGTPEELREIMCVQPWFIDDQDLPLAAKCWEALRYAK